jgi:hypothetical protein
MSFTLHANPIIIFVFFNTFRISFYFFDPSFLYLLDSNIYGPGNLIIRSFINLGSIIPLNNI